MPRIIDYPRGSFTHALEIAGVVSAAGGVCAVDDCAAYLGKKVSGAFKALVSAAIKHGFIVNRREVLTVTPLYQRFRQATDEEEQWLCLKKAFLAPALYQRLYDHFRDQPVPVAGLDELLIREFGADEDYASRLAGYFTEGARMLHLIRNGRITDELPAVRPLVQVQEPVPSRPKPPVQKAPDFTPPPPVQQPVIPAPSPLSTITPYSVTIEGPGLRATLQISAEADLHIAEALLTSLKSKMGR